MPPEDVTEPETVASTVSGDENDNVIDSGYLGDPEGDIVTDDNTIVLADGGNDTVHTGEGDDTIFGGEGDDSLHGDYGNDYIFGGSGADSIYAGFGNDTAIGGSGDDTINGHTGDDVIEGGTGNDSLRGSWGNDTLYSGSTGEGDDFIWGGWGDDRIVMENDFGNDTILGDTEDEIYGDTLDLTLITTDLTLDLRSNVPGEGSVSTGANTAIFDSIEHFELGAGKNTILLGNDFGHERLIGFTLPTPDGSGGLIQQDVLDLGDMVDDYGQPVDTADITLANDADGNLVLTFPGDNTVTLVGLSSSDISGMDMLAYMGIPKPETIPCFTAGTKIATVDGLRAVEELDVGDLVFTRDHGVQEIRWIGKKTLTPAAQKEARFLAPIKISQGALGNDLPERDIRFSPNHRVMVTSPELEVMFGESEVLVAAKHLTRLNGVTQDDTSEVTYVHVMFDRHEILWSEGVWTESFQPGAIAMNSLDVAQRDEIFSLFPELATQKTTAFRAARRILKKYEAELLPIGKT